MKIVCITPVDHLFRVKSILESKGEVIYRPHIKKQELSDLLDEDKDIDTIFTNPNKQGFVLDASVIGHSSIRTICTASTGLNHIDIDFCRFKNIRVCSLTTDYEFLNTIPATAEHAFALTSSLIRQIPQSAQSVKDGKWDYEPFVGRQMQELRFGVIGCGRLGNMYASYARAFSGKRVLICDPYKFKYEFSLQEIFELCDVISLHVHVSDETRGMINKRLFRKPFYLINTSRGEIVNEEDIIEGIEKKIVLGYATDVVTDEFGDISKSPIINASKIHDNIIVTPHVGGMTLESQNQAFEYAANKL